jgi:hypothetical protein
MPSFETCLSSTNLPENLPSYSRNLKIVQLYRFLLMGRWNINLMTLLFTNLIYLSLSMDPKKDVQFSHWKDTLCFKNTGKWMKFPNHESTSQKATEEVPFLLMKANKKTLYSSDYLATSKCFPALITQNLILKKLLQNVFPKCYKVC